MKQNDIAMLILVVAISFVASWFIFNAIFTGPDEQSTEVEVVNVIRPDFEQPSNKIFNDDSFNPTELIQIDEQNNNKPF